MENLDINSAEGKEASFDDQNKNKESRWQRRQFAEAKMIELSNLPSRTPEQEEEQKGYARAVKAIDEEIQNEEKEYENLKPLKESINGILRFSDPIEGWEAIQTNDWMAAISSVKESIEAHDLSNLMLALERILELSKDNLNRSGFGETDLNGSLQRRAIKDIERLLRVLTEYESKEIPIPWNKI